MRVNEPVTNHEAEFEAGSVLVSRTDAGGRIVFANRAFAAISGFSDKELLGSPHNLVRHPHMPQQAFADLWRTIKAGRPWEGLVKNRTKTGDYYWVRANVTPVLEDGVMTGFISIRTKPSRRQVAAAEQAYAAIRGGSSKLQIEDGMAFRPGLAHALKLAASSVVGRLAAGAALSLVTACGAVGVCGAMGAVPAILVALFGSAVVGAVAWSLQTMLRRQLGRLEHHLEAIGRNDIDHEIEMPQTREFRQVVSLLRATKAKLAYAVHERAELTEQAERSRREGLEEMARKVEDEAREAMEEVARRTAMMASAANDMSGSANRTGSSASSAAAAAEQTQATAQAVASAAEQLSASIQEISQQMGLSNTIVARAMEAGRAARETMQALSDQVSRIDSVAEMINGIASQTRLLALNATIEAARAGEAGKGFAVVAGEVKQLAMQTTQSTEEIGRLIAAVREGANASVAVVGRIEETIAEVDGVAGSIAAAVEEQSAATAEIASNVAQTATAANEMMDRTNEVSQEASRTGDNAADVLANSRELDGSIEGMRRAIMRVVRTSSAEVERRHLRRRPCYIEIKLNYDGKSQDATLWDLSEEGCNAATTEDFSAGQTVEVVIARFGKRLQGRVAGRAEGHVHIAFSGQSLPAQEVDQISAATVGDLMVLVKKDHLAFVQRVADAVTAGEVPRDGLATQHACRLGRWYDSLSDTVTLAMPEFQAIAEPHHAVHDYGCNALAALRAGDTAAAGRHVDELRTRSDQVVRRLEEFGRAYASMLSRPQGQPKAAEAA